MMNKKDILRKYPPSMENVLLILHEFQNSNPRNYLSEKDLKIIAAYLNVPSSSIYGVASYYTLFSLKPRGKYIIRICHSPVCAMTGAAKILAELRKTLNVDIGETTTDGLFTLETSECLGQCDTAPGMAVNQDYHGNLTSDKIQHTLSKYQK